MAFITMVLERCGNDGEFLGFGTTSDELFFGSMVVYGFFFITIVQVIGIIMGDKNTWLVIIWFFLATLFWIILKTAFFFNIFWNFQNIVFAMCGFVFYLAVGSDLLNLGSGLSDEAKALGAMCILTAFLFLADTVVSIMKKNQGWLMSKLKYIYNLQCPRISIF